MNDSATAIIAIVGIVVTMGTAGIVACVWLWAWRGRALSGSDGAYRKLAEDMGDAQRRTAFHLGQIAEDVDDMRTRMIEVERLLNDVG